MPIEPIIDLFSGINGLLLVTSISTFFWSTWKIRKRLLHTTLQRISDVSVHIASRTAPHESAPNPQETVIESLRNALEASRQQLDEQPRHLQMLYQVTEQLNHERDLSGVISVTLESLRRAANLDFVAIVLGDDELGPFHYAGVRGVEDPLSFLGQECALPLWGTLAHALVQHPLNGEPDFLVINDIRAQGRPTPGEFPWNAEDGSLMIVPMRQAGRTTGAILMGSRQVNHFDNEPLQHFVYTLIGTASHAIQEALSRRQSDRWIKQLVSLQSLTHTITRTHDLDSILAVLYSELSDLFGEADIRIFLNRPSPSEQILPGLAAASEGRLHVYAPQRILTAEKEHLVSNDLVALLRWTMEAEQPLFFDPTMHPDDITDFYYRSSGRGLLVPIGEENPKGVIYLSAPERATLFEEGDLIVVRTIGHSIAIALDAIDLHEKLTSTKRAMPSSVTLPAPPLPTTTSTEVNSAPKPLIDHYSGVT